MGQAASGSIDLNDCRAEVILSEMPGSIPRHRQALEMQEGQLTQMLEFTEQELRKNMEALRRDLGTAMDGARKKMEEAIGQAEASASMPSSKPNTDVVVTLRVRT
jgi:hypothetical protein